MTIPTLTNKLPFESQAAPFNAEVIATIANALFKALPGESPELPTPSLTDLGAGLPHGTDLPAQPVPAGFSAPAGLSVPVAARPPVTGRAVPQPVLPSASSLPVTPSFYFLNDAARTGPAPVQVPATTPVAYGADPSDLAKLLAQISSPLPQQAVPVAAPYYFLAPSAPGIDTRPELALDGGNLSFDVQRIRRDFPILAERVNGKPLVWFDNAATTHKPQAVIDRLAYFYQHENSNIHRAAHALAARATDAYEAARDKVARFIGARSSQEIIFVRGATEGLNLLAHVLGAGFKAGDEILVSQLEHHANIVPWQMLAQRTGAVLKVIPVDDTGQLRLDEYRKLLSAKTRLVSLTQVSNALGTVTPVQEVIALAHQIGAKVIVDAAQSVSHLAVNVQALDADFLVFSGHKIFGPTGIGVVYGKAELLDELPPYQGGGNMIADVTFEHTQYQDAPNRFEAGTGNIADAVGLGAALDYVSHIGLAEINAYEHQLLAYITEGLQRIPGIRLIGTAAHKASVASFVLQGYSTEQVGKALNEQGIAVRSGHHCAQPILRRFGVETTVRPSLAFYNTYEEIDLLLSVVQRLSRRG